MPARKEATKAEKAMVIRAREKGIKEDIAITITDPPGKELERASTNSMTIGLMRGEMTAGEIMSTNHTMAKTTWATTMVPLAM